MSVVAARPGWITEPVITLARKASVVAAGTSGRACISSFAAGSADWGAGVRVAAPPTLSEQ